MPSRARERRPEWAPPFEHLELDSPQEVDALSEPPSGHALPAAWAWEDEITGRVRARVFPLALGIEEDEATGAAARLPATVPSSRSATDSPAVIERPPSRARRPTGSPEAAVPSVIARTRAGRLAAMTFRTSAVCT